MLALCETREAPVRVRAGGPRCAAGPRGWPGRGGRGGRGYFCVCVPRPSCAVVWSQPSCAARPISGVPSRWPRAARVVLLDVLFFGSASRPPTRTFCWTWRRSRCAVARGRRRAALHNPARARVEQKVTTRRQRHHWRGAAERACEPCGARGGLASTYGVRRSAKATSRAVHALMTYTSFAESSPKASTWHGADQHRVARWRRLSL